MYSSLKLALKYGAFFIKASNGKGHGIHSPFVFNFILNVLNNGNNYQPSDTINQLHKELLSNKTFLEIEDLGAGSRVSPHKKRTIANLAKTAVKPKKYSHLLFRLAKYYQPKTIVELGTSLGITTSLLAAAVPDSDVITIEGSKAVYDVAQQNINRLQLKNIKSLHGSFDALLPSVLNSVSAIELGYIDGNHRYEPTLSYFHQFLAKRNYETILIFDDIHWSREMEDAWEKIKLHPDVRCTIDIFFLGFVIFRDEIREKQNYVLRF